MTCVCATNADGIFLCHECCKSFEEFLCGIGDVVDDLTRVVNDVNLTAQYGGSLPGPTKLNADLPFNVDAFDKREAIKKYLVNACSRVAMDTGDKFALTVQGLTDYLFAHVDHLRIRSWGPEVVDGVQKVVNAGTASVALAEPKTFAGNCAECQTDLYARQGEAVARCRTCGTTYQVQEWRAHAKIAKEYHIGTPAELSRALTNPEYGIDVTVNQICMWAKRNKLKRVNDTAGPDGEPLKPKYSLSDVLNLNAKRRPLDGAAA